MQFSTPQQNKWAMMFSTCLAFSPCDLEILKEGRGGKKRQKETPRKDSWLSNGHFRPRAAQINLIYGEISSLSSQFFTLKRFLDKTRLEPFHWDVPSSSETVSTIWLFYWILIGQWRRFNGHFSIRQCTGWKHSSRKTSFCGEKSGKVSSFQAGVTLQEANIYSGPGIRRNRKRAKKRRSKNKVKWKHLTVFPEKNSHFVSPLETANGETLQNIIRQGKYEKPYFGTDCI